MPVYRQEGQTLRTPRLPRLGIIRLGTKETRTRPNGTEYIFPKASEHFVLDDAPQVADLYGEKPTVIEPVFLPVDNEDIVASHWLRYYTTTWGLSCRGDGLSANRLVDQDKLDATGEPVPASRDTKKPVMMQVNCPCPLLDDGQCREVLVLSLLLPEVAGVGVWQVSTGSANSIANIQGSLAMIRAIAGRISGIPLKLSLIPMTVTSLARGGKVTIHVLQFDLAKAITPIQLAAAGRSRQVGILPPPDESSEIPADSEPLIVEAMGDPAEAPVQEFTSKREMILSEENPEKSHIGTSIRTPSHTHEAHIEDAAPRPSRRDCVLHPGKMMGKTPNGQMGHPVGGGEFCYGVITQPQANQIPTAFAPPMAVVSEQPLPNPIAPPDILPSVIDHNEGYDFDKRSEDIAPDDEPTEEISTPPVITPKKRPTSTKIADDDSRVLVIKEAAKRLGFNDFQTGIILGGEVDRYLNSGKTAVMAVKEMEEFAQRRKVNLTKATQQEETTA